MVAANESSIKEMIERVKVEAGEEDCMICLEELKVGFEASRLPCSHVFHVPVLVAIEMKNVLKLGLLCYSSRSHLRPNIKQVLPKSVLVS
ncbi:hypothetical protein Goklo_013019 [Gossypium klotzschianum]|uniref:RING-type domain-containing protein n=1 Tax=Gossypium klotzschianum TaxID=34286 RepID=A0A7J8U2Y7_9ROSI|nr:hypothetical protein [Gossypium klotzschianum]